MSKTMLAILKREYMTRLTSKGFWISTLIFPVLTIALTVLPSKLAMKTKESPQPLLVVDTVGDFYVTLQKVISKEKDLPMPVQLEAMRGRSLAEVQRDLNTQAEKQKIQGYIVIDNKAIDEGTVTLWAQNPSSAIGGAVLDTSFAEAIRLYRLHRMGYSGDSIDKAIKAVTFNVERATNDPRKKESGISAFYMSFGLVFFIYFSLILYGMYVLQGVLEEKSSRVVEVLISSVKPFELMMGKILGIGSVGLTQIAIWIVSALVCSAPMFAALFSLSPDTLPKPNTAALAYFPVFFVLGYFLFATIYAGIGSMFNSMEDAQQLASTANMLLVTPMIFLVPVIKNPAGPLAVVLSEIPFFAPVLMYLRIAVQTPPFWQIALSIGIMLASIVLMIWLVSKIYRVGILMYGKKPTVPEIMRWLRYS